MLADELRALEAKDPQPAEAGVAFTGPFDLVYETNLRSLEMFGKHVIPELRNGSGG